LDESISREERISRLWSEGAARRLSASGEPGTDWTTSPTVQEVINERLTASPRRDWLDRVSLARPGGLGRALSIGCGSGILEREVALRGMCESVLGLDIAEGALELARQAAAGMPIEYAVVDLEAEEIPGGPYDTAFAVATLHHINRLGDVARKLHSSLLPGGLLVVSEFTGPCRFQWTRDQLRLVADIYSFLPWSYRMDYACGGTVPFPQRSTVCSMIRSDPSEAVRSTEIEEALNPYFRLLEEAPIGGTLLNPLLSGTLGNFDETCGADAEFIRAVADLEDRLIAAGVLPSDFKLMLFEPRPEVLASAQWLEREAGRASLIAGQERTIDELHDDFLALAAGCGALRDEMDAAESEIAAGRSRAEALARETDSLKRGVVFSLTRRARGGREVPGRLEEPASAASEAGDLPAEFGDPAAMASASARAAAGYARALQQGGSLVWVLWLGEVLPPGLDGVAVTGLEPGTAQVASILGQVRLASGGTEPCDLVIAGSQLEAVGLQAACASVREGGWLALVSYPGSAPREGRPEGFALEARLSVPRSCHAGAADAIRGLEAQGEMAAAVAALRVYAGSVLASHGLSGDSCEVALFRKGAGPAGAAAPRGVTDVTEMQEMEIQRLREGIQSLQAESRDLERRRLEVDRRRDAVAAEAVRLELQKDILLKRGPLMYARLVRLRKTARRGPGRSERS
jgi:SAM-dependent methyltransferase